MVFTNTLLIGQFTVMPGTEVMLLHNSEQFLESETFS